MITDPPPMMTPPQSIPLPVSAAGLPLKKTVLEPVEMVLRCGGLPNLACGSRSRQHCLLSMMMSDEPVMILVGGETVVVCADV